MNKANKRKAFLKLSTNQQTQAALPKLVYNGGDSASTTHKHTPITEQQSNATPNDPIAMPENKVQSDFTKEHLYNLDSDDDELDFLRKDFDFDARDNYRKQHKINQMKNLQKNYERKYPLEQFEKPKQVKI